VDPSHAREHRWTLARALYTDEKTVQRRVYRRLPQLDGEDIEALLKSLRQLKPTHAQAEETLHTEIEFF